MDIRKFLAILIFLVYYSVAYGQENILFDDSDSIHEQEKINKAKNIPQDKRIDELVQRHIQYNKHKNSISGYRIRIYSNLGRKARKESDNAKARFYSYFPDVPIYRKYESPYFKVYVGNFRTINDALNVLKNVKYYFPSAFIVPDKIKFPKL